MGQQISSIFQRQRDTSPPILFEHRESKKRVKCHICPRVFENEQVMVCECGAIGPGEERFWTAAVPSYVF